MSTRSGLTLTLTLTLIVEHTCEHSMTLHILHIDQGAAPPPYQKYLRNLLEMDYKISETDSS